MTQGLTVTAQQQSEGSAGNASDAAKRAGGLLAKLNKWFGRGQQVKATYDDAEELQSWQGILSAADGAIKRDTSNNPGPQGDINVDVRLMNLAQAQINYFGAKATVDGAGLLSAFDPSVGLATSMLPILQQSVSYAQGQYNQAISAWAANLERHAASVTVVNPQ
jgi:hypothetical protein